MKYIEYMLGNEVGTYLSLAELRSCMECWVSPSDFDGVRVHRYVNYDYDDDFVRYIRIRNGRVVFSKK